MGIDPGGRDGQEPGLRAAAIVVARSGAEAGRRNKTLTEGLAVRLYAGCP